MDWTGSKFMKSGEVQFGAVALVLVETIFGKLRAEVTHDSVARHFGDHARGRDGQTVAIAVNNCGLRKWKWKNRTTIDQNVIGRKRERAQRDSHRFVRRAQNINPIDLEMIDNANAPRDLAVRNDLVVDFFAQFRRELFRIV